MNLQQLEYLKVIAETKNFTTASNILSVTQPALSKAISKLEQELEVSLFEREGRNIKITEFGEAFLKYADSALIEIERGKEKLQDMKKKDDNVISIASTYCIGAALIPFLISNFLNKNLDVRFNINNERKEEILKELNNGRVDFGFIDNKDGIKDYLNLQCKMIKQVEYVLIVPKNHRLAKEDEVSLKDLEEEAFIGYKGKEYDQKVSYTEILGFTPKIIAEPDESSVLAGLVSAGAGIAIVPDTPAVHTNKISAVRIKEKIGYKSVYMVWNEEDCRLETKRIFKEYAIGSSK